MPPAWAESITPPRPPLPRSGTSRRKRRGCAYAFAYRTPLAVDPGSTKNFVVQYEANSVRLMVTAP